MDVRDGGVDGDAGGSPRSSGGDSRHRDAGQRAGAVAAPPPPPLLRRQSTDQFKDQRGLARVALGAALIAFCAGVHSTLLVLGFVWEDYALVQWSTYFIAVCFFHISEFIVVAKFHPDDVTFGSFLLTDNLHYQAAALVAWVEFWVEYVWAPQLKGNGVAIAAGLVLVVVGQYFRAAAMWTAGEAFTHQIQTDRREEHSVVQHGVYALVRHPGYFGWYWWSVGLAILLGNPLSTVAYAIAAWYFFAMRIPYEEMTLNALFPGEYAAYAARVRRIGIPCIKSRQYAVPPQN